MSVRHHPPGGEIIGTRLRNGYGSINTLVTGSGNKVSITVSGNGKNAVRLKSHVPFISTDGAAGTLITTQLKDGATIVNAAYITSAGVSYSDNVHIEHVVPAFSGEKTFHLYVAAGAGTVSINANSLYPCTLEALWADE